MRVILTKSGYFYLKDEILQRFGLTRGENQGEAMHAGLIELLLNGETIASPCSDLVVVEFPDAFADDWEIVADEEGCQWVVLHAGPVAEREIARVLAEADGRDIPVARLEEIQVLIKAKPVLLAGRASVQLDD